MYDTANGDRVIDMPGLQDTRAIDAKDNTYNDEAILRKLLTFLTAKKINTIHGINWHLQPATRIDEYIKREAKFINDLVGREGWKNVVVLIVDDLRPRHEPPIRAAIEPYTSYDALPIRGCVLDEEAASVKSISLYENQPKKNAETLAGLRISHRPIQVQYILHFVPIWVCIPVTDAVLLCLDLHSRRRVYSMPLYRGPPHIREMPFVHPVQARLRNHRLQSYRRPRNTSSRRRRRRWRSVERDRKGCCGAVWR